jgi:hypothetical protein
MLKQVRLRGEHQSAKVSLGGKSVATTIKSDPEHLTIEFNQAIDLIAGQKLKVSLS